MQLKFDTGAMLTLEKIMYDIECESFIVVVFSLKIFFEIFSMLYRLFRKYYTISESEKKIILLVFNTDLMAIS